MLGGFAFGGAAGGGGGALPSNSKTCPNLFTTVTTDQVNTKVHNVDILARRIKIHTQYSKS